MATSTIPHDNTTTLTTSVSIETSGSDGRRLFASCTNKVVHIDVILYPANNLTANTQLGVVTLPRHLAQEIHAACITQTGGLVRVRCTVGGGIYIENAVSANNWIAVSLVGVLT